MRRKWLGLLLLLVCGPLGEALAEEPAKEEKPVVMEEVVVTATKTPVPVKDTSVSYTVITEQEIKDRQAVLVDEMLRSVPGVNVVQQGSLGSNTSLYIRGGSDRMNQVLMNGMRLNDAGGGFDWSSLTVDNVERIEVIRGPMSALYGADAMTGVVNIITKKGYGPPSLTVSGSGGVHSENGNFIGDQRVSLLGSYKDFSYSMAYGRLDDKGILPINNRFYSNTLNSRLDYDPCDKLSFTFTTWLVDQRFGFPTENGGDVFDPKSAGGPGLDPNQNNTRLNLLLGLTTKYTPFKWWEHELNVNYNQRDVYFNDPRDAQFSDFDKLFGSFFSRNFERRSSLDYHENLRFGAKDSLESVSTVGVAARAEQLKQQLIFGPAPFSFPGMSNLKTSRSSTAFYGQEQIAFWNRLFLTGGVRVEDNSVFEKVEVAPRASAAFRIKETDTTLRAAGGRSIKEPTFLESFSRDQLTAANPKLKPEKNLGWEVGVDQYVVKDKLKFGVTYFENHFNDLITFVPRTFPQLSSFENIGAVRTTGLEFALRTRPWKGISLGGTYTHFFDLTVLDDGGVGGLFFKAGQDLLRRPRNTFSLDLEGKWSRFGIHVNSLYTGPRDDSRFTFQVPFSFQSERVANGGYFITNVAAYYDLWQNLGCLKKVRLLAQVHNLFNKDYQEIVGFSSPRFYAVGGLRLEF
jgi:vitamin B12 transporter